MTRNDRLNASTFRVGSDDYARWRPRYPAELFEHLTQLAPSRRLAWDCGAGSGQAAVALAAHFDHVVASDISIEQLRAAHAAPHVSYVQAASEQVPLPRGCVALVTAAQAAHWFDLPRFHAEVRRVLEPEGVLALFGYTFFRVARDIDDAVRRVVLDPVMPYWARGNGVLSGGYGELDFPYDELRMPRFEIAVHWRLDELLGYVGTWSAVKRWQQANGASLQEPARRALAPLWGSGAREVRMPMAVRVGRLR
jgi:SAM-dependent methyltransferase